MPNPMPCLHLVMSQFLSSSEFEKNFDSKNGTDGSETDWCARMVVVPKSNNKVWICVDFTHLNESVQRERHSLPAVHQTLAQLTGAKIFSKLDANSGFWLQNLHSWQHSLPPLADNAFSVYNLEKIFAPVSWASVWCTAGSECLSLCTLSLRWVKSTQIHTLLFDFGTTTILAHQSVSLPSVPFFESKFFSNSLEERNCDMTRCRQGIGFGIFL